MQVRARRSHIELGTFGDGHEVGSLGCCSFFGLDHLRILVRSELVVAVLRVYLVIGPVLQFALEQPEEH